jgi:hypothetical protein
MIVNSPIHNIPQFSGLYKLNKEFFYEHAKISEVRVFSKLVLTFGENMIVQIEPSYSIKIKI